MILNVLLGITSNFASNRCRESYSVKHLLFYQRLFLLLKCRNRAWQPFGNHRDEYEKHRVLRNAYTAMKLAKWRTDEGTLAVASWHQPQIFICMHPQTDQGKWYHFAVGVAWSIGQANTAKAEPRQRCLFRLLSSVFSMVSTIKCSATSVFETLQCWWDISGAESCKIISIYRAWMGAHGFLISGSWLRLPQLLLKFSYWVDNNGTFLCSSEACARGRSKCYSAAYMYIKAKYS